MFVNLLMEFVNLPTLAGIIIISRLLSKGWQIGIGVVLILLGLFTAAGSMR